MSKLKTEVAFVERNGRTLSRRTQYYDNGQVAEEGIYSISQHGWSWNVPLGVVRKFHENGQLMCELPYNDSGVLEGEVLYYDPAGELVKRQIYSRDRLIKQEVFKEEEVVLKDKF